MHRVQTGAHRRVANDRCRIHMARITRRHWAPLEPGVIMIGKRRKRQSRPAWHRRRSVTAPRRRQSWIDSQPVADFGHLIHRAQCGTWYSSSLSSCRCWQGRNPPTRIRRDRSSCSCHTRLAAPPISLRAISRPSCRKHSGNPSSSTTAPALPATLPSRPPRRRRRTATRWRWVTCLPTQSMKARSPT